MTIQSETRHLSGEIDLPKRVFSSFHQAQDFLTETAETVKETVQQAKESLVEATGKVVSTVTGNSDKAVDPITTTVQPAKGSLTAASHQAVNQVSTVTSDFFESITAMTQQAKAAMEESIEQTKISLGQALQAAEQMQSTASDALQTAIASAINDWLQAHPTAARLVQVFNWAIDRPIISLVILLFVVAIAWSLIRSISRLLEVASLSLLQAPFKLGKSLMIISTKLLGNFGRVTLKQLKFTRNPGTPILPDSNYQLDRQIKQQRLAEISLKLEAIRQEQNQLLQEAAAILDSATISSKPVEKSNQAMSEIQTKLPTVQ